MGNENNIDFQRLRQLDTIVRNKTASRKQRDEYMALLYQNGSITQSQFNDYQKGRDTEMIVETALAVGAIALFAYVIAKLISN